MFCCNNSCCCFTAGINDLTHHFALDIASSKNTGNTGERLFVCWNKPPGIRIELFQRQRFIIWRNANQYKCALDVKR